ncbi:hypothetical protein SERLADRAFT_467859, partial [Serpula lacrymans var. lacrymans S7.9]
MLKYSFKMDHLAVALFLDLSLYIVGGVDVLSAAVDDRRSPEAFMMVLGGKPTLYESGAKALHRSNETHSTKLADVSLQAW